MAICSRTFFASTTSAASSDKDLTDEAATRSAARTRRSSREKGVTGTVAVGRDNRPSGDDAARRARRRTHSRAASTSSTSASSRRRWPTGALHHLDVVGGIQITGSHNPPEYNGFKLGARERRRSTATEIQHLYDLAVAGKFPRGKGTLRKEEVIDRYVDDIVEARRESFRATVKVVIDCGNGAGALVAPQLFRAARASKPRCLFCESDGTFPNHHPDPTVPEESRGLSSPR